MTIREHAKQTATAAPLATSATPSLASTPTPVAPSSAGLILQAKLQVGAAHDPLEAEADKAASEFMSWADGSVEATPTVSRISKDVHRDADGAAAAGVDMMGSFDVSDDVESRINSAVGGGKALPNRENFESFFDTDLSAVRVHEGAESADLNRSIAARAFTTGTDVFLGADASTSDSELMAHELTHVVQQTT
jgi:Domain of unknown function (DUF4157)